MEKRQWLYRITPSREDMLETGPTLDEAARISEHFEYLKALAAEGKVLLAGRTLHTGADSFGIVIYLAGGEASARMIFEDDPAVRAGVFVGEFLPFAVALTCPAWEAKE
jgi:uncharacterized protein YciI